MSQPSIQAISLTNNVKSVNVSIKSVKKFLSGQKLIRVNLFERTVQYLLLVEDLEMKIVEDLEGIH